MMQYILTSVQLMLIAGIIYSGVGVFYHAVSDQWEARFPVEANAPVAAAPVSDSARPVRYRVQPIMKYRQVEQRNLFKTVRVEAEKQKAASDLELSNMAQTKLKLKLWGTVSGQGKAAYAVIDEGGREGQNLYREGDTVKEARVKRILREKVVLTVNGKDEILEMDPAATSSTALPVRGFLHGRMPPLRPTRTDEAREETRETFQLKRSVIDESLQDINSLMKQVKIRPHFRDGQPDGLMLSQISANSIFRKMGLKNGDIVIGVDGKEIESVEDAMKFYENLIGAASVALQIRRRGQVKTIQYDIE
ncbi:MAG: hypothetical protein CSA22_04595 [Deltaproteobacteria bacterium]|nr:MAG: hypothetical protein CSA22_04595 [Deltaproteobacteria bacterium]